MKRIYIAGPYRAATPFEVQANIRRACEVRDAVLVEGHLPVTPHLLTGHCDGVVPDERLLAALIGLMLTCDEVRVVWDWERSSGTRREIAAALAAGIPVFEHPYPEAPLVRRQLHGCQCPEVTSDGPEVEA